MHIRRLLAVWALPLVMALAGVADANTVYVVNLDTSTINGAMGYGLAFSFQDGSGLSDGNNTVTLTDFTFGGGSAGGAPIISGGASGDLGTSVTLTDSDFANLFIEAFTPGTSLSFQVDLTTNVDAGSTPDFFGFSILLAGAALPTEDDTLGDNFLYFNLDSATPTPVPWATAPGSPVTLAAPSVTLTPTAAVPEPHSVLLFATGLLGLLGYCWRKQRIA